jgi:hypothetical protein
LRQADGALVDVPRLEQGQQVLAKLSFVSITPLGRPVVPLEYSWNATSSSADTTPGSPSRERCHPVLPALVAVVLADHQDLGDRGEVRRDGIEDRGEVRPDHEHLGVHVVDDELDLGRRQTAS